MGPVTDVPLLDRGSPETEQGPAVANPRIRVCSTVVFSAFPRHARSLAGHLAAELIGRRPPMPHDLEREMRVGIYLHGSSLVVHYDVISTRRNEMVEREQKPEGAPWPELFSGTSEALGVAALED